MGDLATADTDEAKVFNVIFASAFTKVSHTSVITERGHGDLPAMHEYSVRDYLREFNPHKSMGSNRLYPRVQRELANTLARLLSIIFKSSWRSSCSP